ncbi:MAG: 3-methyl-2-oxobutanoate hydroxymethyltransferase, partial [Pseudomonadota bacterium]
MSKITIPKIIALKQEQKKLVMLTAYSARIAELADPYIDIILVGDSLGMTLHGLQSTVHVTRQMMIMAGQAVARGRTNALMVIDLPFSTYESSPERAYRTAAEIMQKTGCECVKLEGGVEIAKTIEFLTCRNIPVMGHVGLLPQSVHHYGGYAARGKDNQDKEKLLNDIKAVAASGAFATVIEGVDYNLANEMTNSVSIPTLGIGASDACDGQVLVSDDMF